jgi:hypothetical protein
VCAFLDEAFEPAMLDTRVSAAQVSSFKESWKRQVAERIDSSHIQWWRRTLDERTARALTYCCLPFIRSFGYEVFDEPRFSLKAYALSKASIEKYEQRFVDAAEAGIRLLHWEDPEEPSRRELVVLDAEEQVRRVRPLVALVRALVRGWIRGEPLKAYYGSSGSRGGWLTRVLLNALERQEAGPVH